MKVEMARVKVENSIVLVVAELRVMRERVRVEMAMVRVVVKWELVKS